MELGIIMCYSENWKQESTCLCGKPPPKKLYSAGIISGYEYPIMVGKQTNRHPFCMEYHWVYPSDEKPKPKFDFSLNRSL